MIKKEFHTITESNIINLANEIYITMCENILEINTSSAFVTEFLDEFLSFITDLLEKEALSLYDNITINNISKEIEDYLLNSTLITQSQVKLIYPVISEIFHKYLYN